MIFWDKPIRRTGDWMEGRVAARLIEKVIVSFPDQGGNYYCVYNLDGTPHNPNDPGYAIHNFHPDPLETFSISANVTVMAASRKEALKLASEAVAAWDDDIDDSGIRGISVIIK